MYDALVSIDVPTEKARAVIDALEHDMGATLATKQDVLLLRQEIQLVKQELDHRIGGISRDVSQLEQKIAADLELLRSSMTARLGSIQVVTLGLLFAALKLI